MAPSARPFSPSFAAFSSDRCACSPGDGVTIHGSRGLLALATLALLTPFDAHAHRPPRPDAWWAALDAAATSAPAEGVLVLRAVRRGRVRIPAATFTMGSTPSAMARALALCEREVRAPQCHNDNIVALVRAEGIAHRVTISSFELDRTETT